MIIHSKALYEPFFSPQNIIQTEYAGFDVLDYSKFKFGMGEIALHYAELMKIYMEKEFPHFLQSQLLISSSAFKFVPTASHSIAFYLFDLLQNRAGLLPIEKLKIHRDTLFERDYGTLNQSERVQLMAQNHLYFEEERSFEGKKLLVIDDVYVTGSHENRVKQLLSQANFSEVCFLYVAKFKEVSNPLLEHSLNHTWVNSLARFVEIFFRPDFCLNARVCKFLLSYPNKAELCDFFQQISIEQLIHLKDAFCFDGYDKMTSYQQNYSLMNEVIQAKESVLV